jgi:coenzyme F420-reducing hydrogenase gamma subunit
MSQNNKQKKKVGIFSFSCDEGCSIFLTEIFNRKLLPWLEQMDLAYFLAIKEKVEIKDFDIVLVEGMINTQNDLEEIKNIRANTKLLLAMGSCAISAMPSAQRNSFSPMQLEEIQDDLHKAAYLPKCLSVKEAVTVDDEIPGCPIDEAKFIEVFEKHLSE